MNLQEEIKKLQDKSIDLINERVEEELKKHPSSNKLSILIMLFEEGVNRDNVKNLLSAQHSFTSLETLKVIGRMLIDELRAL